MSQGVRVPHIYHPVHEPSACPQSLHILSRSTPVHGVSLGSTVSSLSAVFILPSPLWYPFYEILTFSLSLDVRRPMRLPLRRMLLPPSCVLLCDGINLAHLRYLRRPFEGDHGPLPNDKQWLDLCGV